MMLVATHLLALTLGIWIGVLVFFYVDSKRKRAHRLSHLPPYGSASHVDKQNKKGPAG